MGSTDEQGSERQRHMLPEGDGLCRSQVLDLLGVTQNALFNYERHGIVQPRRNGSGYRRYSANDTFDLMACNMLLSLGYSVSQVADLMEKHDDILSEGQIEEYCRRLERERDIVQAKMDNLAAYREMLRRPLEVVELVECPEWTFYFDNPAPNVSLHTNDAVFLRSIPLSCRGFAIPSFLTDGGIASQGDYWWAHAVRTEHAALLPLDGMQGIAMGGPCIRVKVPSCYPVADPDDAGRKKALSFLSEHGLTPCGDPFVPLILNNRYPATAFEVYVPVR